MENVSSQAQNEFEEDAQPVAIGALIRSYLPIGVAMMVVGAAVGAGSLILDTPMYKASVIVEVKAISESYLRNSQDPLAANYDATSINLQTELSLLKAGPFIGRVRDRYLASPAPPPPRPDIFAKLRAKVRPHSVDPAVSLTRAVWSASNSFEVHPINGTRLLELSCESTNPTIASSFINSVATDFVDDGAKMLSESNVRTSEWVGRQFAETKSRLEEAELKLRDFVRRSGNVFITSDSTVDDVKVKQLQSDLAKAQADRIAKQARYETAMKNGAEQMSPDALESASVRGKITDLRSERASLLGKFTPNHPKVQQLDAQIAQLEKEQQKEQQERSATSLNQLRSDYEDALRHERLLGSAYAAQSGQVVAQAGKAAEYSTLKREVDSIRTTYDALLQRLNQSGPSSALPVSPMRMVDASLPPEAPYKPKPSTNVGFGILSGLALTIVFAFVREKADSSLKDPGSTRWLLNLPELGIIPAADKLPETRGLFSRLKRKQISGLGLSSEGAVADAAWSESSPVLAESFRTTLASLVREAASSDRSTIVMITSPEQGDGKTTVTSNLGIAIAETGRTAIIIDADFRKASMSEVFRVRENRGLADILEDRASIDSCIVKTTVPGLCVLPASRSKLNVARLLYSSRLDSVVNQLRQRFDFVLIDVPPILTLADSRIIGRYADGVVLVVRAGKTSRSSILAAYQCLIEDRAQMFGTILNSWDVSTSSWGKNHYYYNTK